MKITLSKDAKIHGTMYFKGAELRVGIGVYRRLKHLGSIVSTETIEPKKPKKSKKDDTK